MLKVILKKYKRIAIELAPVYFNLTTKTVINYKFHFESAFQGLITGLMKDLAGLLN